MQNVMQALYLTRNARGLPASARRYNIAGFMGLTEKNVSVRLTRIREKLRQYLIEREVFI
nr:MAG TPA: ECF sigma factor [Caudoviricetes sp.]